MPSRDAGAGETGERPAVHVRTFTDAAGREWSATHTGEAVVFTCRGDARMTGRAIAIAGDTSLGDIGDETLRSWLAAAPRIGLLT
jgi:hypothetical protein